MAKQERIFSIKIEGLERSITTLKDAQEASNDLTARLLELQTQLLNTDSNSQEYALLSNSISETEKAINELNSAINVSSDELSSYNNEISETAKGFDKLATEAEAAGEAVDLSFDPGAASINDIRQEMERLEEVMNGLDTSSDAFKRTTVKVKQLEQAIIFADKEAEAIAKGFVGLGKAGNTIEGLTVKITALEEQLGAVSDPLERADIQRQITEIEFALEDAQAAAKRGIFPPGTIGALTADIEAFETQLRRLPVGSQAFNEVKAQLDETNKRVELLNLSVEDQRQLYRDLGASITSAFTGGLGLLSSFAEENDDVQKALLQVQQAIAAIETISQVTETLRLARQANKLTSLKAESAALDDVTAATQRNTQAQAQAAGASGQISEGLQGATKSGRGFSTIIGTIGQVIKANPLLFLASVLITIGTALNALSKRFKPLAEAFNFIEDAIGGVQGGFRVLTLSFEKFYPAIEQLGKLIVDQLLLPFKLLKESFAAAVGVLEGEGLKAFEGLGNLFENQLNNVIDTAQKFGEAGELAAEEFSKGFKESFDRSKALRELALRETLNQAADFGAQLEEAVLGSVRATEDQRRQIRIRELAEDRRLALERLKIEQRLSDEELNILKSGNEAKIAELSKLINARGEVDAKILEQFGAFAEQEKSLLAEQEAARLSIITDRIAQVDRELAIQGKGLESVQNFANREILINATKNAELEKLNLRRQAGEFKTLTEFNQEKILIEQQASNEILALNKEREVFIRELAAFEREQQVATIEFALEKRRQLGTVEYQEEVKLLNDIKTLRLQTIQEELEAVDLRTEDGIRRERELQAERVQVERDTQVQITQAALSSIEKRAAAQIQFVELTQKQLEVEATRLENTQVVAQSDLSRASEALERQKELAISLDDIAKSYQAEQQLISESYQTQIDQINTQYELQIQQLEAEASSLDIEDARIEALKALGEISEQEYSNRKAQIELSRQEIQARREAATIQANVQIGDVSAQAQAAGESAGQAFVDGLSTYLANPIDAELSSFLQDTFGKYGSLVKELGTQLTGELLSLQKTLFDAQITTLDGQVEQLNEQIATTDERITELTDKSNESLSQIAALEAQVSETRGANQQAIISQITQEREQQKLLQDQIAIEQQQRAKFEQEQIAIEAKKRQLVVRQAKLEKAAAIAEAVANTAVGITKAIASVPPIASGVIIALYAALGAAQVATIAAQPIPEAADGGKLRADGTLEYAQGGKVVGKSHAAGGVRGTGKFNNVEVEGGEWIINKKASINNDSLLRKINSEGTLKPIAPGIEHHRWGGILKYQAGGVLPTAGVVQGVAENTVASRISENTQALNSIQEQPVVVSVVDIAEGIRRVETIDTRAGL